MYIWERPRKASIEENDRHLQYPNDYEEITLMDTYIKYHNQLLLEVTSLASFH